MLCYYCYCTENTELPRFLLEAILIGEGECKVVTAVGNDFFVASFCDNDIDVLCICHRRICRRHAQRHSCFQILLSKGTGVAYLDDGKFACLLLIEYERRHHEAIKHIQRAIPRILSELLQPHVLLCCQA